jgi:hypothetical protein
MELLCFFFLVFLFVFFPAEGVLGYWFCGFLAARGVSPAMRLLLCFNSVVFYLVLDLCVLARIYATRASLWCSRASFGLAVTSCGRAFLPCLVRGQHAQGSFLPSPACEGYVPPFRSQVVMIWTAKGCLLQGRIPM